MEAVEFMELQFKTLNEDFIKKIVGSDRVPDKLQGKIVLKYQATEFKTRNIRALKRRYMELRKLCKSAMKYLEGTAGK